MEYCGIVSNVQDSDYYIPSPDSKSSGLSGLQDSLIYIPSPSPRKNEAKSSGLQDSLYHVPSPEPSPPSRNNLQRSLQFMFELESPALSTSLNPRKRDIWSLEDAPCHVESPKRSKYMRITSTPKSLRKRLAFPPLDDLDTITENPFLEELHSDHNESICSDISELGEVHATPHKSLRRLKRLMRPGSTGEYIFKHVYV